MSARSINCLNAKGKTLSLPAGNFHRIYSYRHSTGTDQYLPEDGPLGWFFRRAEDGKDFFLGKTMDEALEHLDNWEHGRKETA